MSLSREEVAYCGQWLFENRGAVGEKWLRGTPAEVIVRAYAVASAHDASKPNDPQEIIKGLREELATAHQVIEIQREGLLKNGGVLRKMLTVAELRNAVLEQAISTALDDSCEGPGAAEVTIMQIDYEALCALVAKPTESGAGE